MCANHGKHSLLIILNISSRIIPVFFGFKISPNRVPLNTSEASNAAQTWQQQQAKALESPNEVWMINSQLYSVESKAGESFSLSATFIYLLISERTVHHNASAFPLV